jgi:carbohydrate-selective porin OprB
MMNKKMAVVLMTGVFMLVAMLQQVALAADDSLPEYLGLEAALGGTFVLQHASKINTTTKKECKTAVTALFDIDVSKEFENDGEIVFHLKNGEGAGVEPSLSTYGDVNTYAATKNLELFYKQSWFDNKLTANFGRFDLWRFFAENKVADEFITAAFGGDKLIDSEACGPSLRLGLALHKKLDLDLAYFTPNLNLCRINKNAKEGIALIQANFKPFEDGNYRLYVWQDNADHYTFASNEVSKSYGFGISLDQAVDEELGFFVRFGYKDHRVGTYIPQKQEAFNLPLSTMWSFGTQIKGLRWSRENDIIGIAVGQIFGSSSAKGHMAQTYPNYEDGPETHIELYYKVTLNNNFSFTPAFQYLINPAGGNATSNKNIFVFGIRGAVRLSAY